MLRRQWHQFHLLKVLCQHSDAFGLSFPGPERISALTGLGTEKRINAMLEWLVDGEYVKVHEEWNRRKRIWDREFQVSPFVMYIREDLQGYCEKVWHSGERDFDYEQDYVIKRNGQPSPESESESSSDNHPQNQHHHPAKNAAKQQGQGSGKDYTNRQRRRRKTGNSPTENDNPQAGGPPPPEKIDLRRYKSPLLGDLEDQAQDLHVLFGMRIHQARGLVANYPPDVIDAGRRAVVHAMEAGRADDPPALLTYLIKKAGVSPQDRNIYPTRDEKIAAANAAMMGSTD